MQQQTPFLSGAYWDARYRHGGASGAGSLGRLAQFKAGVVNRFIDDNDVASVIDLGCGDGSQLAMFEMPENYVGVDVSPTVVARCTADFPRRRFITNDQIEGLTPAELTLSLDVLFHLTEDDVFAATLQRLFGLATRYVLIYSSNADATWPSPHVRHRAFTRHVARTQPGWRLVAHLPNPYPFDPSRPDDTSFADFFVYARPGAACSLHLPATTG